eukprot:366347-Chlamydomonas_euryale.AAC.4
MMCCCPALPAGCVVTAAQHSQQAAARPSRQQGAAKAWDKGAAKDGSRRLPNTKTRDCQCIRAGGCQVWMQGLPSMKADAL